MSDAGPFDFRFLEEFGVPLRRFAKGETLFRAGEPGTEMLLVIEGNLEVKVAGETAETVGLHGIVGEMALIDAGARSATVVGASAGEVAVIDRLTFLDLVRENPAFSLYVMQTLARRVRRMNAGE